MAAGKQIVHDFQQTPDESSPFAEHPSQVSIIIVTMGADAMLKACIHSIQARVDLPLEIIIVNNAATPLDLEDAPALTIIENGTNMGFARAVNRGLEMAASPLVCLLNSDTYLTEDIIAPMVAFMHTHARAGICGLQLVFGDGALQNSLDIFPNLATEFLNKSLLKLIFRRSYPSKRSGFTAPVRVPSVIGACMMIRRALLDTIGDLDEGYFFYLEETDLCRRAWDHGYEVWHLPQLRLVHYQGGTARRSDIRRKIEFRRSVITFFRRHRGPLRTALLVALSVLKSLIELAGALPLVVTERGRQRLITVTSLLLWYLSGRPEGWGLERTHPLYEKSRAHGYTWFLKPGKDLPSPTRDPQAFMEGLRCVLNLSRTACVKSGQLDGKTIFIKRYNFKGWRDACKNLFRKSRALRAFESALLLENLGVPTPAVVFACERRILGVLVVSYIATEGIDALDLVRHQARHGFTDDDIRRLARCMRRLHEMGILHVDLKGENLLIDDKHTIHLIDLDRLRRVRHLGLKARAKNLSYLNASFATTLPGEMRALFLDEYLKGHTDLERQRPRLEALIHGHTQHRLRTRYPAPQ